MTGISGVVTRIRQFFTPPVFEDKVQARIAVPLNAILLILLAASTAVTVWHLLSYGLPMDFAEWFTVLSSTVMIVLSAGLLFLLHRGHVQTVGVLLASAMWIIITWWFSSSGNVHDTSSVGTYFLIITIAGLISGGRAATIFGLACILALTGITYAQNNGTIPTPTGILDPLELVMLFISIGITTLLVRFSARSTAEAFEQALSDARALAEPGMTTAKYWQRFRLK